MRCAATPSGAPAKVAADRPSEAPNRAMCRHPQPPRRRRGARRLSEAGPEWADAAALGAPRRHGPVPRRRRAAAPPGAGGAAGGGRRAGRPDRAGGGVDGVLRGPRARRTQWAGAQAGQAALARRGVPAGRLPGLRGGVGAGDGDPAGDAGRRGRGARLGRGVRGRRDRRPASPPPGRSRRRCSRRPASTARSASATPWSGPRSRPTSASRRAPSSSPATTGWTSWASGRRPRCGAWARGSPDVSRRSASAPSPTSRAPTTSR